MSSPLDRMEGNLLGPVQIGYALATFLYGLMSVQTYDYFQDFPDDPLSMKTLVAAVWLTELGHQLSCTHSVYFYTVSQFRNPSFLLAQMPKSIAFVVLFHGLTTLLVSWFFISRLWRAAKETIVASFLGLVMFSRSIIIILVAGFAFKDETLPEFYLRSKTILTTSLSFVTIGEILLTISLCYDLYRQRGSSIYRTWTPVHRFIMWMLGTGLLTSVVAIVMLICFITTIFNFVWLGIFLPLSRLFAIAFLVSLNARGPLRRAELSHGVPLSLGARTVSTPTNVKARADSPIHVMIEQETLEDGLRPYPVLDLKLDILDLSP